MLKQFKSLEEASYNLQLEILEEAKINMAIHASFKKDDWEYANAQAVQATMLLEQAEELQSSIERLRSNLESLGYHNI